MKISILVILGTGRKGSQSEKVAHAVYDILKNRKGISASILDVKKFPVTFTVPPWQENREGKKLRLILRAADAYFLIMPEYNRGYPGELKLLFDRSKNEFKNKPILICGVSSGSFGGSRAVENFIPVLTYLEMKIIMPILYFPNAKNAFTNGGSFADKTILPKIEKTIGSLQKKIQSVI
ncbi:MAG: NAD(P)H-dependent oxidoreductase [Patescibacteria group bacterium]